MTPRPTAKVDVLRLFTESMRRHGLGHGFYYSVGNNVYLNVENAVAIGFCPIVTSQYISTTL
jgi:hypothetical protein